VDEAPGSDTVARAASAVRIGVVQSATRAKNDVTNCLSERVLANLRLRPIAARLVDLF
jgi:hypothetical protein